MSLGELVLDLFLSFEKPVHRQIKLVFACILHSESFPQRHSGTLFFQGASGGKLGTRGKDASCDHGEDKVAFARLSRSNEAGEFKALCHSKHGGDMPVRQTADDVEGIFELAKRCIASKSSAERLDLLAGPVSEIGEGSLADPR